MPRIYAPLTIADLDALVNGRSISLSQWHAAPGGLTGDDLEEAEYDALRVAGEDAAELVGPGRRRVLLAADVDPLPDGDSPAVVTMRQAAAFHVDETVEHSDEDLLWYDAAEITDVVALASAVGGDGPA